MNARDDAVDAYADLEWPAWSARMGQLRRQGTGRGELLSFEYAATWLATPDAFAFDRDLALADGPQYPPPATATLASSWIPRPTTGGVY